jgi:hypothetical protein
MQAALARASTSHKQEEAILAAGRLRTQLTFMKPVLRHDDGTDPCPLHIFFALQDRRVAHRFVSF